MSSLVNKRVWITGASSGLGEALAREAASQGAQVVLSARSEDKLNKLAQELPESAQPLVLPLDLTKSETFEACLSKIEGPIDYLINNGGISQRSLAIDTTLDVSRSIMETNFFGTIELTRLVLPRMIAQGSGMIATVTSLVGHFGTPFRASYSASKHALHGYFDSLYYEVAKKGIDISLICPGFIHTDISINAMTADGSKQGTLDKAQANGMKPDQFARIAWKGLIARKREIYIGGKETNGIYLKRFFPRIFDWVIQRREVT